MKTRLPYFEMVERVDRKRGTIQVPAVGFVDCEIAEAAGSELREVASWKFPARPNMPMRGGYGSGCSEWRGSLYTPTFDIASCTPMSSEAIMSDHIQGADLSRDCVFTVYRGALISGTAWKAEDEYTRRGTARLARIVDAEGSHPDEHEQASAVRQVTDDMLIVDGSVWQRIERLHAKTFTGQAWFDHGGVKTYSALDYTKNRGHEWHLETQGFWNLLPETKHEGLNDIDEVNADLCHSLFRDVRIYRPDMVAFDERSERAERIITAIGGAVEPELATLPGETIALWVRMRDARRAYRLDQGLPLSEDGIAAILSFAARVNPPDVQARLVSALAKNGDADVALVKERPSKAQPRPDLVRPSVTHAAGGLPHDPPGETACR